MNALIRRKVFFSFHYQRDVWRVSQVRNCNVISNHQFNDFLDKADWEKVKKSGDAAIKNWIREQLKGTSITVVLIGKETSSRKYVRYEILESHKKGNALLGIRINNIRDENTAIDSTGQNPFLLFTEIRHVPIYDWVRDNGQTNIAKWINDAIHSQKQRNALRDINWS